MTDCRWVGGTLPWPASRLYSICPSWSDADCNSVGPGACLSTAIRDLEKGPRPAPPCPDHGSSWTHPPGTAPSPLAPPSQSLWQFKIMAQAFRLPSFRYGLLHFISTHLLLSLRSNGQVSCRPIRTQPLVDIERRGKKNTKYWADGLR